MKKFKNYFFLGLVLLTTAALVGCGEAQNDQGAETVSEDAAGAGKTKANLIFVEYLKVKDALVGTDGKAAQKAATGLVNFTSNSEDRLVAKIQKDAEAISQTADPHVQRDRFYSLSQNIYDLVQSTKANETPLYKQFCPMARENKGAFWLSAEKEVMNPYFGDQMLNCGVVQEEL